MGRVICAALLAVILGSGCATVLSDVGRDAEPAADVGYLAVSFREEWQFLQFFPSFTMRFVNREDGKSYIVNSDFESKMRVLAVPAGSYVIANIGYIESSADSSGKSSSRSVSVRIPDDLLMPFDIEMGKISILGEVSVRKKWNVLWTDFNVLLQKPVPGKAEDVIRANYPRLAGLTIDLRK